MLSLCTEHKAVTDEQWQKLLDELNDLNVKLSALRQRTGAADGTVGAGEELTATVAEDAAMLKQLGARKHAVNQELDSTREEVAAHQLSSWNGMLSAVLLHSNLA